LKNLKFVDLFAGLGGFRNALEQLAKEQKFTTKCVFVSEINEKVIQTYKNNYLENNKIINIKEIDSKCSQISDHDILFAGFPCQTFSNAGNKKGFLDEIKGTLFFDIVKILTIKKPKYVLLENVKHIINHDNGRTWELIITKLTELGYIMPKKPLILNPINFGIPQDRSRVFIPLILKSKMNNKKIDFLDLNFSKYQDDKYINVKHPLLIKKELMNNFLEKDAPKKYYLKNHSKNKDLINIFAAWNDFLKNVKTIKNRQLPVIWIDYLTKRISTENMKPWKIKYLNDMWNIYDLNKNFIDKWLIKWNCDSWMKRERKFEWQAGNQIHDIKDSFIQLRQSGIRCRKPISFPTLVAMVQIPIIYDKNWRYLTPRETSNLQSYPKEYNLYNDISNLNNADFTSYMQIGNSVNVKVVKIILTELLNTDV